MIHGLHLILSKCRMCWLSAYLVTINIVLTKQGDEQVSERYFLMYGFHYTPPSRFRGVTRGVLLHPNLPYHSLHYPSGNGTGAHTPMSTVIIKKQIKLMASFIICLAVVSSMLHVCTTCVL